MKKILVEVKKVSDKSFFINKVTLLEGEDFGAIDPFGEFPYELKSEEEIMHFLKTRLKSVDYKIENDNINFKYYV